MRAEPELDWYVDDDESGEPWEPAPPSRQPGAAPPPAPSRERLPALWRAHRKLAVALGILVALAGLSAAGALWELSRRVNTQEDEQRAAVLRLAQLEDRLLLARDTDAFLSLQDPAVPGWREWQALVLKRGALALPSAADPGDSPAADLVPDGPHAYGTVQLDGERAELVVTRRYQTRDAAGAAQAPAAFVLQQRQYYRLAGAGWLRTAPPDATALMKVYSPFLETLYPQSDALAIDPLLARLSDAAERACADLGCPSGVPRLVLTANPEELLRGTFMPEQATVPVAYAPAPLLVGMPGTGDARGRDALFRAYATRLLVAIAQQRASDPDWLRWDMNNAGLAPALASSELQDAARRALRQGKDPIETSGPAGAWLALDFLQRDAGAPLSALFERSGDPPLRSSLARATSRRFFAWWNYLQSVAALGPAGLQLAVSCDDRVMLWDTGTHSLRPLGVNGRALMWSPQGDRLVTQQGTRPFDLLDLRDGDVRAGAQEALAWTPDGSALAIQVNADRYIWKPGAQEGRMLADLAPGSGWVNWAPDGSRVAYAQGDSLYVAAPGGTGSQRVAQGSRGAWWDGDRFLAVVDDSRSAPAMTIYDRGSGRSTTVITTTRTLFDLAWAPAVQPAGGRIAVATRAADAHFRPHSSFGVVSIFDVQGNLEHSWTMDGLPYGVKWSPDGRYIAWQAFLSSGAQTEIFVASLADERVRVAAVTLGDAPDANWGWSPDGAWIAADDGSGVLLSSVDGSLEEHLPDGCRAPLWRPDSRP